jgi:3',5'-cyclic-nucleotide phosphodiesterase
MIWATVINFLKKDGTNNMFEVKRKTELALMYNSESVLENMHISTLWKILKSKSELNFLNFSKNPKNVKETIIKLILSTDMSSHFKNLETLQKRRK